MDDLRRLLAELRGAEEARQRLDRTSPEYEHATEEVDRISRAVWEAVQDDRAKVRTAGRPTDGEGDAAVEASSQNEAATSLDGLDGAGPPHTRGSDANAALPPSRT